MHGIAVLVYVRPAEEGDEMVALDKKISGASLIEAVVASTIFLIVFICSLETLTRLTSGGASSEYILVEADHMTDIVMNKYSTGTYPAGIYTEEFGWGDIIVRIDQYVEYENLMVVSVRSEIHNSRKQIKLDKIISVYDNGKE